MALAEMCKARAAVHKSIANELVEKLQALGCCQFIQNNGTPVEGAAASVLLEKLRHIDWLTGEAKYLIRLLGPLETNGEGTLAKMFDDGPTVPLKELVSAVDEKKFLAFVTEMRDREHELADCRAELSRLRGLLSQAVMFKQIKYPLVFFNSGTDTVSGIVYSVRREDAEKMSARLAAELGDLCESQKLRENDKEALVFYTLIFRKDDAAKVQQICGDFSASRVEVPKELTLTAAEEEKRLSDSISELEAKDFAVTSEMASHANEGLKMARNDSDSWGTVHDRLTSMISGEPTNDVFIWSMWMPKTSVKRVKAVFGQYSSLVDWTIVKPDKFELAPTLLKNPSWSAPVEELTLMYGTPTYGKVDPTTLMAPFFFLFMGMCFGDAGYGLLLSAVLGFLLLRHQLQPTLRKFCIILFTGMLCTIVYGLISGSFFGDAITAFGFLHPLAPFMKSMQLLDPMNDPMTVLIISLIIGFVQIIFGLCIAFWMNWRSGDKFAACADQGGWILFLIGLVMTGLSMSGKLPPAALLPSEAAAGVGAVVLVATQGRSKESIFGKLFSGIMSLYGVTSYLGDVLSYSRLLALGLGSAAVGLVINLLCNLVSGFPYVGFVLAILLFIVGHTFSIAINLLGAFVHPLRLQYVEFFSKFYDGNGYDFDPLRYVAQYSKIS